MSATRGRLRGTAPVRTGHVQQRVHAAAAVSATSVPDWQPTTVGLPMQIVQPPDGQADQERARMARGRPAGRPVTTSRLAPRADTPLPFVRAPAGTVDLDAGIVDCIGALRDLPRRALPTELHDVRTADLRRAAVVAGLPFCSQVLCRCSPGFGRGLFAAAPVPAGAVLNMVLDKHCNMELPSPVRLRIRRGGSLVRSPAFRPRSEGLGVASLMNGATKCNPANVVFVARSGYLLLLTVSPVAPEHQLFVSYLQ